MSGYLASGLPFLAVAATVAAVAVVRLRTSRRRYLVATALTALLLLVLTAVFDSVMIAADLFRYDAGALVGLTIGRAPVEDLAWPLAAALLLPALWTLLARPEADRGD
jgi:lycopene cyclase domain-containing protein